MNGKAIFSIHVMGEVNGKAYDVIGDITLPGTLMDDDNPTAAAIGEIVNEINMINLGRYTSKRPGFIRVGPAIIDPTTIRFLEVVSDGVLIEEPTDLGPDDDDINDEEASGEGGD